MQTPWEYRYAHRMQRVGSSVIRELLKFTEQPDIISFAGGLPAPEVFPVKEFQEACNVVLAQHGAQAFNFGGAGWNVTLPAETGIDGHNQYEVRLR